jgi:pyrroline-5-carboxylate reductase
MTRAYELGFVGGGHMAEGIVAGVLRAAVYPAGKIIIADPSPDRRKVMGDRFGVVTTDDNPTVIKGAETLVLAIKPQTFSDAAAELGTHLRDDQLVVSIMAGWSTASIAKALGRTDVPVVRVMPNLPIRIGAGTAGICRGSHATEADVTLVRRLFDAGGQSVVIEDEQIMHAVTAVSGSGPAYYYYFTEAIVAGGMEAGLSREQAVQLAQGTCLGAARMMLETGIEPSELRRQVTSPGGTTQSAMASMEWSGVAEAIKQAVLSAARRSKELGT